MDILSDAGFHIFGPGDGDGWREYRKELFTYVHSWPHDRQLSSSSGDSPT